MTVTVADVRRRARMALALRSPDVVERARKPGRVRTPAGVNRYKQPIGTLIAANVLDNLRSWLRGGQRGPDPLADVQSQADADVLARELGLPAGQSVDSVKAAAVRKVSGDMPARKAAKAPAKKSPAKAAPAKKVTAVQLAKATAAGTAGTPDLGRQIAEAEARVKTTRERLAKAEAAFDAASRDPKAEALGEFFPVGTGGSGGGRRGSSDAQLRRYVEARQALDAAKSQHVRAEARLRELTARRDAAAAGGFGRDTVRAGDAIKVKGRWERVQKANDKTVQIDAGPGMEVRYRWDQVTDHRPAAAPAKAPTDKEFMAAYEAYEADRAKGAAEKARIANAAPLARRPSRQPADEVIKAKATPAKKAAPRKATRPTAPEGMVRKPFPADATTPAARIAHLRSIDTREQARDALADIRSRRDLEAMARELDIPRAGRLTADELRSEILQVTVGRRIDTIARRGFTGPNPSNPGESADEFFRRTRRDAGLPPTPGDATPDTRGDSGNVTQLRPRTAPSRESAGSSVTDLSGYRQGIEAGLSPRDASAFAAWLRDNPGGSIAQWQAQRRTPSRPSSATGTQADFVTELDNKNQSARQLRDLAERVGLQPPPWARSQADLTLWLAQNRDHPGLREAVAALPGPRRTEFAPGFAEASDLAGALIRLPDEQAIGQRLAQLGTNVTQLRRLARELNIGLPSTPPGGSGRWTAAALREHLARIIVRDRHRFSWR